MKKDERPKIGTIVLTAIFSTRRKEILRITKKDFAEKVGVSAVTVRTWENGGYASASLNNIIKVADILNLNISIIEKERNNEL